MRLSLLLAALLFLGTAESNEQLDLIRQAIVDLEDSMQEGDTLLESKIKGLRRRLEEVELRLSRENRKEDVKGPIRCEFDRKITSRSKSGAVAMRSDRFVGYLTYLDGLRGALNVACTGCNPGNFISDGWSQSIRCTPRDCYFGQSSIIVAPHEALLPLTPAMCQPVASDLPSTWE